MNRCLIKTYTEGPKKNRTELHYGDNTVCRHNTDIQTYKEERKMEGEREKEGWIERKWEGYIDRDRDREGERQR